MNSQPLQQCPKCGCEKLKGPQYLARGTYYAFGLLEEDGLLYRCARCGYEQIVAPLDRRKEG